MTTFANGGLIQPRDDGDSIPVMLSRGSCLITVRTEDAAHRVARYRALLEAINGGDTDVLIVMDDDA